MKPEDRTSPFSHDSVKQGKYSYLSGPNVKQTPNGAAVEKILEDELLRLRKVAAKNPTRDLLIDETNDETDPLKGFGTAEHRKKVETKAVEATKAKLKSMGYSSISHEHLNCGYDLQATHIKSREILEVEVKGTSGTEPRLFLTANEYTKLPAKTWRLAMVTNALRSPEVSILNLKQFNEQFDLTPMVWIGRPKDRK